MREGGGGDPANICPGPPVRRAFIATRFSLPKLQDQRDHRDLIVAAGVYVCVHVCVCTQEGSTAADRLSGIRDRGSRVRQEFRDRGVTDVDVKYLLRGN